MLPFGVINDDDDDDYKVTWSYFAGLCGRSVVEHFTYEHGSRLVAGHVEAKPGVWLGGQ